jgi:hypothetical protein
MRRTLILLALVTGCEPTKDGTSGDEPTAGGSSGDEGDEGDEGSEGEDGGSGSGGEEGGGESGGDDGSGVLQDCQPGATWTPGTPTFTDASADWGLPELMPVGVRVSAVDFDGDGWTDLAVRGGSADEDFSEGGSRNTWLLRNTGDGRFADVTEDSGLLTRRDGEPGGRPGPVHAWGDVDNDGDLDVYTGVPDGSNALTETSELMLNNGDGTFTLGPAESGVRMEADDMPYGAAFVDVDRDGWLDLWTTQYGVGGQPGQDRLLVGDGTGAFSNLTRSRGLNTAAWRTVGTINAAEAHTYAWSALACDLDNDGAPELLSASYGRSPNHLWHNDGAGDFENQSVASGYAFDHRVDWSDNESARCHCTLFPEDSDCEGIPEPDYIACRSASDVFRWSHSYDREPFRLGGNSGATVCADVDNDGWFDLLTTEIVHWDVGQSSDPSELLFNTGEAPLRFERPGNDETGLVRPAVSVPWDQGDITGSIFDFDNDGWLDVWIGSSDYPGTRGLLYHQDAPRSFSYVDPADGPDHTRSHGSAVADFDRDGDLDIVVGHSSMRCDDDCRDTFEVRLFENLTGEGTNWVQLDLRGDGAGANRSAVGARVEVETEDGLVRTAQVSGGYGQWGNQDDRILHFGLGTSCEATVRVVWPDAEGSTDTVLVGSGYRWLVEQGTGEAEPVVD